MKALNKFILGTLALFITFFVISYSIVASSVPKKLVVNYFRYDNDYTGFNIWLWENQPNDKGGIQFNFSNENIGEYGAFLEVDLEENGYADTTRFGIIVKRGAWGGYQEPGGDRFLLLEDMEVINGVVNAYIVEQDLNIGVSSEDLENNIPNYDPKVLSAYFDKTENINFRVSHKITSYEIFESNTSILKTNVSDEGFTFKVDLDQSIDLLKTYELKVVFEDRIESLQTISIQNLYDTKTFEDSFTYEDDLGVIYSEEKSVFRLWAPLSESVKINLYNQGHPGYDKDGKKNNEEKPFVIYDLERIENGAWEVTVDGDLKNKYYTFTVTNDGISHEVTDPYSYSTGANGSRSMIVNFNDLNPENWEYNSRPDTITNLTDYLVYELHVRDLTVHDSWNGNDDYRGKFMGFTETGTTYTEKDTNVTVSTGLDHIVELGVNAVQLIPVFDFGYIDEVQIALDPSYSNTFNWGYMPYHFNTLEGSYSTNPFDGGVRINEFKQLVQALHDNGIRVIMDVVYNHTGESESSNFHKIIPGYYHRMTDEGGFHNGSGTGNETASERTMVRKFMLDSLKFLTEEYNFSGYRFDLMKLHDVDTMIAIEEMLHEIDPTIVVYGEPWTGGTSPDTYEDAGKTNLHKIGTVGAFNDTTRDGIKGATFGGNVKEGAWAQGYNVNGNINRVKYGIVGGIDHPDVSENVWHTEPSKTINYVSAHDNHTLHDKLRLSGASSPMLERLQIQSNAIILTSQGIPFLHAGVEFMRSKPAVGGGFDENSYESPDEVNQLRWDRKARYNDVFEYYKTLIQIRRHYPQFRFDNKEDVLDSLTFLKTTNNNTIAYEINHKDYPSVVVVHNNQSQNITNISLPEGKSYRALTGFEEFDINGLNNYENTVFALAATSVILIENTELDNVSLKSPTVNIERGDMFNPLDNINYDEEKHNIYHSNFYNTNIPGSYLISIMVVDSKGNFIPLNYNLIVGGLEYNFDIKGVV